MKAWFFQFTVVAFVWTNIFLWNSSQSLATEPQKAPSSILETGLYLNGELKNDIDPRNLKYSPQYPLWTDDAKKSRWIYLPPGRRIDATDPDHWIFPEGTQLWKEFSWNLPDPQSPGTPSTTTHKVETRYLKKLENNQWLYATYVWNDEGTNAFLAPKEGVPNVYEIRSGIKHNIPSISDCRACHEGTRTEILGFNALQLSPDRDPNAPHADPPSPDLLTLETLIQKNLIQGLPQNILNPPPRIRAATPTGRAAKGYLHANCGCCHNATDPVLSSLGLFLQHAVRSSMGSSDPVLFSAIDQKSYFQIPKIEPGQSMRIKPGSPSTSSIAYRMSSRNPIIQMPPLGTQIIDQSALQLVIDWIQELASSTQSH